MTLPPLPKRHARGNATGFCGGIPVGEAETARGVVAACWWPDGPPALLELDGMKTVATGRAGGNDVPGHGRAKPSSEMSAVAWRLRDGRLHGRPLPSAGHLRSWAGAAGGGLVVGVGVPSGRQGERGPDVGLVWRDEAPPVALAAKEDALPLATDGTGVAGSIGGRPAWWPAVGAAPVLLAPEGAGLGEAHAIDGGIQAGHVYRSGCPRAALWRGDAATFVDLTPAGFATGRVHAAAAGLQAGVVREVANLRSGAARADDRAALWDGTPEAWIDLNALLPTDQFNGSTAWGLEVRDGELRVCGQAIRYEVSAAGTPGESHFVSVALPVLWTARLA